MSSFSTFDFSSNADWQSIEKNLYFSSSDQTENDRILLKRKRKWYKANIDSAYEWDENERSTSSTNSNTSSTSSSAPKQEAPKSTASSNTSSASSRNSSSNSTNTTSSNPSSAPKSKSPYLIYVSYVQMALHVLMVLNVILYILPLAGIEQQSPSFFRCMMLNLIVQVIYLVRQHGRPRWNSEYGRAMFTDEQSHFLFLSIVLLNATPSLILLLPFLSRSILFICGGLKQLLPQRAPKIYALIQRGVEWVVDKYSDIYRANALIEVVSGISLILNLATASRNFMLLIGFWQYLRIRYMLSQDSKTAFGIVRRKIDEYAEKPFVPQMVRNVWTKIVTTMESYSDEAEMQRQAQAAGGAGLSGMMSKCTIM